MASTCFRHLHVHLQEFLYSRLFHYRMCCYALGVVAVVLRSWCEVMCTVCQLLTNSAQDYTSTPQDHSLNTYGITPHAVVKQPVYKNSWRWTCKCPKHVEAIYENKIIVKLFASSWYIFLTYSWTIFVPTVCQRLRKRSQYPTLHIPVSMSRPVFFLAYRCKFYSARHFTLHTSELVLFKMFHSAAICVWELIFFFCVYVLRCACNMHTELGLKE